MSISPIPSLISSISQSNPIQSISPIGQSDGTQQDGTSMFGDLLNNMIGQVNSTDSAFQGDIVKAAQGELDNPQQLVIDSSKAQIALQLVTNVRNTAIDSYNDIIKMSV